MKKVTVYFEDDGMEYVYEPARVVSDEVAKDIVEGYAELSGYSVKIEEV